MSHQVTVYFGFEDLSSYLAVKPTIQLGRQTGAEFNLLPIVQSSVKNKQTASAHQVDDPHAAYKARRRYAQERYAARELQRHCDCLGLSSEQGGRSFDATLAAIGLLWLRAQQQDENQLWCYMQKVYTAAFRDGAPVEETSCIEALMPVTEGFPEFADTGGLKKLTQLQNHIQELGILETPAYRIQDELYQGRQHLPRLTWLLKGRTGQCPG